MCIDISIPKKPDGKIFNLVTATVFFGYGDKKVNTSQSLLQDILL